MDYILGLDIGTTGCKATVFSVDGTICKNAYAEYPKEEYDGLIDAALIWEKVKAVMAVCTRQYPRILAVSTASFGETVVAVDDQGKALAPAILYTNANALEEWKEIEDSIGKERINEITGLISHPMYTISRLAWIKRHQPEIYEQTDKFLFMASYIERNLGAEAVAESTLASRSMAYDVRHGIWSKEIFEKAGIAIDKMAPVVAAGAHIGRISEVVCQEVGLKNHPLIIAGGHDQPCVALGMGAVRGGDAAYGMGTTECLTLIMDTYYQSAQLREKHLICAPHVVPGKYITYGVLFSGGVVIKDLRGKLFEKEFHECRETGADIYDLMMESIPEKETQLLYLPHLAGSGTPYMDIADKGVIYGMTLVTSKGEIVKAALEGIAFDMRHNIENMEACGLRVKQIMAGGGGAKSDISLKVRADVLQRDLLAADDIQAGTRGVFYIAARSLGLIEDYEISKREYKHHIVMADRAKAGSVAVRYQKYLKL